MDKNYLENKNRDFPENDEKNSGKVDKKIKGLFSNDPLFGLLAFPDECKRKIRDYELENL